MSSTNLIGLRSNLLKNWAYLLISLSLSVLACQTTPSENHDEAQEDTRTKEEQILDTQKNLVRNNLDSGQPESALQIMRTLVRMHPEDASLQSLMGLTQLALRNPTKAVQHFRRAYQLDKQPGSALNLSSAYIEIGSPEKAQALLANLLKDKTKANSYPYRERIYHNIGYSYVKMGKNPKAEQWLKAAVEENPTFFPSHLELARLYERTKRPAQALKSFQRAVDYCEVCYEPVEALANIHMKMGNKFEARKILTRFTKTQGVNAGDFAKAEALLKSTSTAGLERHPAG